MPIPVKSIRVHGRRYSVTEVKDIQFEGEQQLGLCDTTKHEITILQGSDALMADTLFHEVVHAACPDLTEEQVLGIERSLFAVLADNPVMTKWIFKAR